jgi:hypothetical protein
MPSSLVMISRAFSTIFGPTPTKSQMAMTSFVAPSSSTSVRTLRLSWMPVATPLRAP